MPKPKHDIKEFHYVALKEAVKKEFAGEIIDSSDLQELQLDIIAKTGKTLSNTTLYRLFLAPANINIPYTATLDILVLS